MCVCTDELCVYMWVWVLAVNVPVSGTAHSCYLKSQYQMSLTVTTPTAAVTGCHIHKRKGKQNFLTLKNKFHIVTTKKNHEPLCVRLCRKTPCLPSIKERTERWQLQRHGPVPCISERPVSCETPQFFQTMPHTSFCTYNIMQTKTF